MKYLSKVLIFSWKSATLPLNMSQAKILLVEDSRTQAETAAVCALYEPKRKGRNKIESA
jgi:hypothetical protein